MTLSREELDEIRLRTHEFAADVSPITDREKLLTRIDSLEQELRDYREAFEKIIKLDRTLVSKQSSPIGDISQWLMGPCCEIAREVLARHPKEEA